MADRIRVNTGSLSRTRDNVSSQLEQIDKKADELFSDLQALANMWEGPAHDAFQSSFNSDLAGLRELCEGLRAIVNYETNAVTEYDSCERQVASLISGIKI